jgi:hypothetical protein
MTDGLETTEQRLRTALREAALQVRTSPPPVTSVDRPPRQRRRGLLVALAAALAIVVVAVGAGLALLGRDDGRVAQTPGARQPRELSPSELLAAEADITVFMQQALSVPPQQEASQPQIDAVRRFLRGSGDVRAFTFVDHAAAYREFQKTFQDQPDLVNSTDPNALPVSFRLVLRDCDAQTRLIARLSQQPGVDEATAGPGLSHATAKRLGYRRTQPADLLDARCGYHQPNGKRVADLAVTALPSLSYQAQEFTVPAGIIEITLSSAGGTHTLVFDDPQFRGFELRVPLGPIRGKIKLKPGTYTIYCSIPGHREAGEQATIRAV